MITAKILIYCCPMIILSSAVIFVKKNEQKSKTDRAEPIIARVFSYLTLYCAVK